MDVKKTKKRSRIKFHKDLDIFFDIELNGMEQIISILKYISLLQILALSKNYFSKI